MNPEISKLEADIMRYEGLIKASDSECEKIRLNEVLGFYKRQYKDLTGVDYGLYDMGEWRE